MIHTHPEPTMMQSMRFHKGTFNIAVDFDVLARASQYDVMDVNTEQRLITFHDAGDLLSWLHDQKYEPGFYL